MENIFIGDAGDDNIPFELSGEIETTVHAVKRKPVERKLKPNNVLVIRGKPNNVVVPRTYKDPNFDSYVNEWKTHRATAHREQVTEKTTDVISVPKEVKRKYIAELDQNIKAFTDFLVTEISPIDNAMEASFHQVKQTLEIITNSELDTTQVGTVRAMMRDAVLLRIQAFIAEKMNLTEDQKKILIDKYFKKEGVLQLQVPQNKR